MNLLAAIRSRDNLTKLKSKSEQKQRDRAMEKKRPAPAKKPLSLAEEMRMKLVRRQKLLSGARDEEEQAAASERKKKQGAALNAVSFVSKLTTLSPRTKAKKRLEEQSAQESKGGFSLKGMSGLDAKLSSMNSRQRSGSSFDDDSSDDDWA